MKEKIYILIPLFNLKMKRGNILILIISILVLSSLVPSFVSAETNNVETAFPDIGEFPSEPMYGDDPLEFILKPVNEGWVKSTFTFILGPGNRGEDWFARGLLFILLVAILYAAAKKIPVFSENVARLVAVIVSIIGIRFLSAATISGILLPYGTLAVVASVGLPFVLYFYLIEGMPKTIRKLGWMFFSVIMLGLWFVRRTDIGKMFWAYPIFAVLAFIMFWLDGTIHKLFSSIKYGKEKSQQSSMQTNILLGERAKLLNSLATLKTVKSRDDVKKQIATLDKQIKDLSAFS